MIVYVVISEGILGNGGSGDHAIEGLYSTLDEAGKVINKFRDEWRAKEGITTLQESWSKNYEYYILYTNRFGATFRKRYHIEDHEMAV